MGTIENGFMKGFKGFLGQAVSSKWKGKAVIKSRPPNTSSSTMLSPVRHIISKRPRLVK
jgi:hypothetical protein